MVKRKKGKKSQEKKGKQICNYLKESRLYFAIIIGLFLISSLIGFLFPIFFTQLILDFLTELAEKTQNYNFIQMFFFILENNFQSSLTGLISGIVIGILPIFSTIVNGYVLGFVANISVNIFGYSSLLRLFPHGIFELPAVIISLSLGLKLGIQLLTTKAGKKKKIFIYNLKNSLWIFIYIVIPLLLIAAIIETALIIFS